MCTFFVYLIFLKALFMGFSAYNTMDFESVVSTISPHWHEEWKYNCFKLKIA